MPAYADTEKVVAWIEEEVDLATETPSQIARQLATAWHITWLHHGEDTAAPVSPRRLVNVVEDAVEDGGGDVDRIAGALTGELAFFRKLAVNYAQAAIDAVEAEAGPLEPDLIRMYALLALVAGPETTLQDVHDAWALWRNEIAPEHPSIVPFGELTTDVQEYDRPFRDAIVRASQTLQACWCGVPQGRHDGAAHEARVADRA